MASLEVCNASDDSETFPSGDYSLLPEISTGNMQNKEINHHNNGSFNFTNMQSALTTPSSDSSVEVHSQINILIEENNLLKEKLAKNDQMIEENIEGTKKIISSLENENSKLRETVASLKKNKKMETNSCERCTVLEAGLNNMLGVNYAEENAELLMEWSYFRENLYENLKYISQQLEDISNSKRNFEEKTLLNCYILMLKFKMAFLIGNGELVQFASLRTDEETGFEVVRMKIYENSQQLNFVIENLVKVLEKKDEELTSLKTERENFVEKIKAFELRLKECEPVLKSQSELLNKKLQDESSVLQQYTENCKSLKQEIKSLQNSIENSASASNNHLEEQLKEEIQNLKEILNLEQQTDKEKMSKVMTKCEMLQVDYDRVTKLLEIQSKDEKEKKEELRLKESDIRQSREQANLLTAELDKCRMIVAEKEAKFKILEEKIAELQQEKIKMLQEKEPNISRNQSSSNQKDQSDNADGNILCPICNMRFTDEHAAQLHVNSCLDKSE